MGDYVQKALEGLLPSLLECKAKGLFSSKEISKIVKKRREFEYALAGKRCCEEDFLKYIHYETMLELLRVKRIKKKGLKSCAVRLTSSINHILRLFNRAVRIWPEDEKLWNQYIDFCFRSGCTKRVMSLFLEALAYHPRKLTYWLLAIDREVQMGRIQAPRRLFQLALRQLTANRYLWEEYFKFEMKYLLYLSKNCASRLAQTPLNIEYLNVLLIEAAHQMSTLDLCSFLVLALDYVSVLFSNTLVSYFCGLDAVEANLNDLLEDVKKKEPLMHLFSWKLRVLTQAHNNTACSKDLEGFFKSLESLNITCPYTWCSAIFLLYNLMVPLVSSDTISNSNGIELCSLPQSESLFSFHADSESPTDPLRTHVPCFPVYFYSISPKMITWFKERGLLLFRCLCVPLEEATTCQAFWEVICRKLFPEKISDVLLWRRSINEKKILSSLFCPAKSFQCHVDKNRLSLFYNGFLKLLVKCDLNVWTVTFPLLIALYQHCYLNELGEIESVQKVKVKFKEYAKSNCHGLNPLQLVLLKEELKFLESRAPGFLDLKSAQTFARCLKSISNVPKEYLLHCVNIISNCLIRRIFHLKSSYGSRYRTLVPKTLRAVHCRIKGFIDSLFAVGVLEELESVTKYSLNKLLCFTGSPQDNLMFLELEWSRIVLDVAYHVSLVPVARQIIKGILSMMFLYKLVEYLCFLVKEKCENWGNHFNEIRCKILWVFQVFFDFVAKFDKESNLYTLHSTSITELLPECLSVKELALRYISLVFCLEKFESLLIYHHYENSDVPSFEREIQPLSEKVFNEIKSKVSLSISLRSKIDMITAHYRNVVFEEKTIVEQLIKECDGLSHCVCVKE